MSHQQMFPRSQPVVNWIIRQWPSSPKTRGWMIGCGMLAVIGSVSSEERSKQVDGPISCTWIPFILITINQSHHSPLSNLYSANPQKDPKTHTNTHIIVLFLCYESHNPPMLINLYSIFKLFFIIITSSICNHDESAYCQPHSDFC